MARTDASELCTDHWEPRAGQSELRAEPPALWHDGVPGAGGPAKDPLGLADSAGTWVEIAGREALQAQVPECARWFPIAVKANVAARGMDFSASSPALQGNRAGADSGIVAALRGHGAVVAGISNMHELAFGITSDNPHTGPVRNPAEATHSAGGSSGGCAAAVARGQVPAAIGTDTGGSVAIPAALCGVVGWRPTTGRWPTDGLIGLSWTRDTPGAFTTSVATAAQFDHWVTGAPVTSTGPDRPFQLGIPAEFHEDLDRATARATRWALKKIGATASLRELELGPVLKDLAECEWLTVAYEAPRLLSPAVATRHHVDHARAWELLTKAVASPDVRQVLQAINADPVTDAQYAWAQQRILHARQQYRRLLQRTGVEALLFPTTPLPAPPIGCDAVVTHNHTPQPIFPLMTRHTVPGTLLRAPMLTLPVPVGSSRAGQGKELPVGLTVQGLPFQDERVLATGRKLEAMLQAAAATGSTPDVAE